MPHIPRRLANTSGIPQELLAGQRPSLPRTQPQEARKNELPLVPTLSVRNYTVSPVRVYEQLFGREAKVDERTGRIVPTE